MLTVAVPSDAHSLVICCVAFRLQTSLELYSPLHYIAPLLMSVVAFDIFSGLPVSIGKQRSLQLPALT